MPPVHKAERAAVEFECHINMAVGVASIKPDQLAVQPKVQHDAASVESQEQILASALQLANLALPELAFDLLACLRFAAA
jgi:hypothetical protein